jgi:uncharacterized membrane protein YqiK
MLINLILVILGILVALAVIPWLAGIRYIPHNKVGIVEKLWSPKGSLTGGRIVALEGQAGYQAELLRGGLHAGFFPWQYRIHKEPLVMVSESKIGYVYARDGNPLRRHRHWLESSSAITFRTPKHFSRTAGSADANAPSCAKACLPLIWRSLW